MTKQKLIDPDSYPGFSFDGGSGLDGLAGFFSASADLPMSRNPINKSSPIASHLLRWSALRMMRTMFLRSFASIFKQWDDYCFLSTRKSWETYLLGWQWQLNRSLQGWNRFSWASCLSIIFTHVFQSIYIYIYFSMDIHQRKQLVLFDIRQANPQLNYVVNKSIAKISFSRNRFWSSKKNKGLAHRTFLHCIKVFSYVRIRLTMFGQTCADESNQRADVNRSEWGDRRQE